VSDHLAAGVFWLRHLTVRDFRNLERVDLSLEREGAVVIGDNGQGKTNLLEAIYYLQLFRSARGARDADLVGFGSPAFHIAASVTAESEQTIAAGYEIAGKRKKITRNGVAVHRTSEALGALPSVLISPHDSEIVSGAPEQRRRFLDVILALTSRRYLNALQIYRAALIRRNAVLREVARTGRDDGSAEIWEPALAAQGSVLVETRATWVHNVATRFSELCAAIGEPLLTTVAYTSRFADESDIERSILDRLAQQRALDMRRGLTHAGPHRDDLSFSLADRELRSFGSAGQQRTAAIALRILEASTLRDHLGFAPVLLLDDPFAELDAKRAARIVALLGDGGLGQTILTVPRTADVPVELSRLPRLGIRAGAITKEAA
jgi:DNA replication and repair protein RecF